jgi:hypothetical protein
MNGSPEGIKSPISGEKEGKDGVFCTLPEPPNISRHRAIPFTEGQKGMIPAVKFGKEEVSKDVIDEWLRKEAKSRLREQRFSERVRRFGSRLGTNQKPG